MLNLSLEDEPPKNLVTEWEKTRFFEIFKAYNDSSDKEIRISKPSLLEVFMRMKKDEICLGKIPNISEIDFLKLSEKYLNDEEKIEWNNFRKLLSEFRWRGLEYAEVEGKINKIYKDAQELFHTDKHKECLDRVLDALKIEKHFIKKNSRYI